MDNQHKQIKGYRDLSQEEIDLMNRIKLHAEQTRALALDIKNHLIQQEVTAHQKGNDEELERIHTTRAAEFHKEAVMKLQTGFMLLTRSVAQPTTF